MRGRIARSSKIEGLKGIMSWPMQEDGKIKEEKALSRDPPLRPLSFASSFFFGLFFLSPRLRVSSTSSELLFKIQK